MTSADLVVANCRQLLTLAGPIPKRKQSLTDVGLLEKAWLASCRGRIVFTGQEKDFKARVRAEKNAVHIDARGLVGLPGFVDSHTHLPFAGSRVNEFRLRLKGYTYEELAKKGMGIQTTVKATRRATKSELVRLCLSRLDTMLQNGATTIEAKSGYGLNLKDEIKQLEALREASRKHPVDIVPTFMGAHEIPKEYRSRKSAYVNFLLRRVLPEVKRKKLAEFFDVFCEEGIFSLEDTRRLADGAKWAGLKVRIHADEFTPLGGAELASEIGALSADHLINITPEGIRKLARSDTVATLLPGVSFFLMLDKKAPARQLIEEGAIVSLASDFNPGSSMVSSMLFVLQLGVFLLRLTIEEAINAVTANAAFALGRHKEVGSLEPGKKTDLLLCELPDYASLVYHLGINPIRYIIKNGRVVVKDGRRL
ncbi:MAG: imidazolonepropionase [Clostridiales bacterium]|nr:imidazolonepropionase [Clostridiales bacterium]